jgi:lysophospholipase L1-like esterase
VKKIYSIVGVIVMLLVVGGVFLFRKKPVTTAVVSPTVRYVALGDSVSAGVGLPTASDSSACDRTDESYPNVFAKNHSFALTHLGCSGATVQAGIVGSQNVNGAALPAQVEQLPAGAAVVTLTVGANDVGWTQVLAACYTKVCGTSADTAQLNDKLATLKTTFASALDRIAQKQPGVTLVTGYYQLFPLSKASCITSGVPADASLQWIHDQQARVTELIKGLVAGRPHMVFVPIDFSGHELCTADSWIQALDEKAPFHPTEKGQKAIADQLSGAYNSVK